MNEKAPTGIPTEAEKTALRQERIELARELIESGEVFPFPGIKPEALETIRQEQEEFPGYTTPIDELLTRFENEGVKLVFTKDPSSGNIMVLPAGSDDIYSDFLLLKNLSTEGENIDSRFAVLIAKCEKST